MRPAFRLIYRQRSYAREEGASIETHHVEWPRRRNGAFTGTIDHFGRYDTGISAIYW